MGARLHPFWALFASLVAIFPGLLDGQLLNDAGLPKYVTRLRHTTIAAVAIGISTLAGFVFYWLGSSTRAEMVDVPLGGRGSCCRCARLTRAQPETAVQPSPVPRTVISVMSSWHANADGA